MSEQGDKFLADVFRVKAEPISFQQAVTYLRQVGGSGRGAARLAGVAESSFRRWAKGVKPMPATEQKVIRAVRQNISEQGRRRPNHVLHLQSYEPRRTNRNRNREVPFEKLDLQPGALNAAIDAWVASGDSTKALHAFVSHIGEPWYRDNLARANGFDDVQEGGVDLGAGDYGIGW